MPLCSAASTWNGSRVYTRVVRGHLSEYVILVTDVYKCNAPVSSSRKVRVLHIPLNPKSNVQEPGLLDLEKIMRTRPGAGAGAGAGIMRCACVLYCMHHAA
jgi:hypothetical protein